MKNILRWIWMPLPEVESIEEARAILLTTIERLLALAVVPMALVMSTRLFNFGWHAGISIYLAGFVAFAFIGAYGSRLFTYKTRVVLLISVILGSGLGGMCTYGLLGYGWILSAVMAPCLAAIFLGGAWPLRIFLGTLGAGSILAVLWLTGLRSYAVEPLEFLAAPSSWINMLLLVATFSLIFLTALRQLITHLKRGLLRAEAGKAHLLRETTEQMRYLANHDSLTGLLNLNALREHFSKASVMLDGESNKIGLMVLVLVHFKEINDTLGHATGDQLILEISTRLQNCLRERDVLCRQGGDDFVLYLPAPQGSLDLSRVAEKIIECLNLPFTISGHEISCSLSIGIAVYRDDGEDFDTLLKKADTAMYKAKEAGRNTFRFFDAQMNADAFEHMQLTNDLRQALGRNEFELNFQPQIDVASGAVVGAEALLRWNHPVRGAIPPSLFIPLAERSGLICSIGHWVLHEACSHAARWQHQGCPLAVAVNLSAQQFHRGGIEESVQQALQQSGLPPHLLELELTESIMIQNAAAVMQTVERLHHCGVQISIDDFGTGYSSLAYLKHLRADKLKIDQSFICNMLVDRQDAAIARTVIEIARSLGLKTIAEGVEDERIIDALRLLHCDSAQGYAIARPMSAGHFSQWLSAHNKETRCG